MAEPKIGIRGKKLKRLAQIYVLKLVIGRLTSTQQYYDELSRSENHHLRHVLSILNYLSS